MIEYTAIKHDDNQLVITMDNNCKELLNNIDFDFEYDLKLFDSPTKMREALREKNSINNKSRMIAGYCYEWNSEQNPKGNVYDIELEDGFKAKWNFANSLFAIDPNSFDQVGCIHTTQGLEFDYCGIIIGQDLRYDDFKGVYTDQTKEALSDKTSGIRTCKDKALASKLIRNTYKTLLIKVINKLQTAVIVLQGFHEAR